MDSQNRIMTFCESFITPCLIGICMACIQVYGYSADVWRETARDTRSIVNPHPFSYIINNQNICQSFDLDLLIWVNTAPKNVGKRALIRETWANPRSYHPIVKCKLVFLLGMTDEWETQRVIQYENEIYKDIVQESFVDHYRNLTYKGIAGLKWITYYCKSAKLILKTDDDVVVDFSLLLKHMESLKAGGHIIPNTIFCQKWTNRKPDRNRRKNKWVVPIEEYPHPVFPPYCPGLALLLTPDVVPKLYAASFYEPFFWLEDVYIIGLLGRAVNVVISSLGKTVYLGYPSLMHPKPVQIIDEFEYVFYHLGRKRHLFQVWNLIRHRHHDRVKQASDTYQYEYLTG